MTTPLRLGIAGLGTVGIGTVKICQSHADLLTARAGRPVVVTAVSARSRTKDRGVDISGFAWEDDPVALAQRDDIDVFVELMGGEDGPAKASVEAAIAAGKHVVTANKAMLAIHGQDMAEAAEAAKVALRFEAAVAGGIPVIKALTEGLAGNQITRVMGVMNGTCNYILTRMENDGVSYDTVFADAQALGYLEADPTVTSRASVPVLWDRKRHTIVSNESSEIIRMFNSAFDGITGNSLDFYPQDLRAEIDAINPGVYDDVNNGVYKTGFAQSQGAYDTAVSALFARLDKLEERLSRQRYLTGDRVTEADWRLFPTLVRFDPVYVGHFKCNVRQLKEYPNLWAYTRELYQMPGIAGTVDMDHIRTHYHRSHESINKFRIIPAGPAVDFDEPHGRGA